MTTIIRRVVTKHDQGGKPGVASDGGVPVKPWPAAQAGDAVIWSTAAVPADNSEADLAGDTRKVGTTLSGGSVFRITELGAGFMSPLHRTLSTDYCIVLSGELEVMLDGGDIIKLLPGDAVVQRGTSHAWRNPSDAPCLFLACMIEALPVTVGGKTLGATPMWKMVVSSLATMVGCRKLVQGSPAQRPASPSGSVRRIVTAHNAAGKAIVASETQLPIITWPGVDVGRVDVWSTRKVPPDNSDRELAFGDMDVSLTLHNGSVFRIIELGPMVILPMHRTHSIDYCVLLSGDLEVQLEGGESIALSTGDTLVQRGTSHAWRNPSSNTTCKFVVCMIEARPSSSPVLSRRKPYDGRIPGGLPPVESDTIKKVLTKKCLTRGFKRNKMRIRRMLFQKRSVHTGLACLSVALFLSPQARLNCFGAPMPAKTGRVTSNRAVPMTAVPITLQQLLARHLKALGGRQALARITSLRTTSRVTTGGEVGTSTTTCKRPGMERGETKIGLTNDRYGISGRQAWRADSNDNVCMVRGGDLKDLEDQLALDSLSYALGGTLHDRLILRPVREAGTGDYLVDLPQSYGNTLTMSIDPRTYLIVREKSVDDGTPTTDTFSGYRRFAGVLFPTEMRESTGKKQFDQTYAVTKIETNIALPNSLFAPPVVSNHASFLDPGATSATIPFDFSGQEVILQAKVNGQTLSFLLDSGSNGLSLSPEAAKSLHLKSSGIQEEKGGGGSIAGSQTQIDTFEIPNALRLSHLVCSIVPTPDSFSGVIGLDIFSRFVTRIDCLNQKITFLLPPAFQPSPADGTSCPVMLSQGVPLAAGLVDGNAPGNFLVDTGSDMSLVLDNSFVKKYGLAQRYPNGTHTAVDGVAGTTDLEVFKLKSFGVGRVVEPGTEAAFIAGGIDSPVSGMAGGVGIGFLSQFVMTFDYPHERLFLAPAVRASVNTTLRLGIRLAWVALSGDILIESIAAKAPAQAAGLIAGSQLLAVDGTPVKDISAPDMLDLLKAKPGREAVTLRVKGSDGLIHDIRASYYTPQN